MNANLVYKSNNVLEESVLSETQQIILSLNDYEKEMFEERAAIMEYDGNFSTEEAEWRALQIILMHKTRMAV